MRMGSSSIMNLNYNRYETAKFNRKLVSHWSFIRCKKHFMVFKKISDFPWFNNKLSHCIFPSNRLKYMRPRYYEDLREFERTRQLLPRTIWKSCKLRANLSQESQEELGRRLESYWPRELVAKIWSGKTTWRANRSLLLVFFRTHKVLYRTREGFSHVRGRSRSSLRNSHEIVTFLGGFQRRDLRTRKAETNERTNNSKRTVEQNI